jgi:hypothetical protein
MSAMVNSGLQVQHKKTKLYMPAATKEQAAQHAAKIGVSFLGGASGARDANGTKEYIRADKAKTMCTDMREVVEHCSEQTIYHMLKSIVSKNNCLVSCLSSKLTKQYTETVDHVLGTTTLSLFHPDTTALNQPPRVCQSTRIPRLHCRQARDHHSAERDADEINPSDAFRKRIKQGMDALTVWKEMDKFLIKKQELFRDFASTSMLDAADWHHPNGQTEATLAMRGKLFGSGWQL